MTSAGMEQQEHTPKSASTHPKTSETGVRKYLITSWALLECLLFGGLVFGWGSLVFVLKQEGIYENLCSDGSMGNQTLKGRSGNISETTSQGCSEQDQRLNLVFAVSTVLMSVGAPFMGHIQYKFGTRTARIVMILFLLSGSLMMAFASPTTPWLFFPGLSLLAMGGFQVLVTNIQVAYLFVTGSSTLVSLLSGCFDASPAVQLLVKIAHENHILRKYSYIFISCIFVVMAGFSTFFLMPKMFIQPVNETEPNKERLSKMKTDGDGGAETPKDSVDKSDTAIIPSLKSCAISYIFLSHVGWLCILQLRFYYFIGSLNPWLNTITEGDTDSVSHYTNVQLYSQLGGIITALLCGFFMDMERRRHKARPTATGRRLLPSVIPQTITCVLAVLLSGLVLVPSTDALYVVFILATAFRSFLYGLAAAFVQMIFPAEYFSFLFGVVVMTGGLFGCLQYPLFIWSDTSPVGPNKVNIFLLVLMVISFLHPLHIWILCRKAQRIKNKTPGSVNAGSEYEFIRGSPCCQPRRVLSLKNLKEELSFIQ